MATSLFGQGSGLSGAINGFVSDPSGAAVAGASVKVINVGSGASFTAATTSDGFYTMRFLVPGTYRVEVSQPGFKTLTVQNVLVQTASTPTVNAKLELGAVAQSVTVTATTSLLEMQRADTGTTVENKLVDMTPENQGTLTQIYYETPGVQPVRSSRGYTAGGVGDGSQFSVNGSAANITQGGWHGTPNNVLVDGVSARESGIFSADIFYNPSENATAELKVVSLPFSAEYGHTIGGAIIVTTKSGGNRWHGRGLEEVQPAGLRANNFTNNYSVPLVPRPPGSVNHEVGYLGGAIKKDKLFVFGDAENWYNTSVTSSYMGSVPTAAMRQGDFTQQYYNSGTSSAPVASMVAIYDPFSCATYNTGGVCQARYAIGPTDPHFTTSANVIPYSAWSPVAQALFPSGSPQKYFPLPTGLGAAIGSTGKYVTMTNNFIPPPSGWSVNRYYIGRMDYDITPSTRIMTRYIHTLFYQLDPQFYPDLGFQPADNNFPYIRQGDSGGLEITHTLSPTSVLSFTVGFWRFSDFGSNAYRSDYNQQQLNFSPTFVAQSATDAAIPVITFTGGSNKGGTAWTGIGTGTGTYNPAQTTQFYGLWSKSMGRQTLKVGAELVNERAYNRNGGNTAGAFSFDPEGTELVPLKTTPLGQGDSFASFLLGVSNSLSIARNVELARQAWTTGAYFQDDIKVSPRLTINAGVRWDWTGALTDRHNLMSGPFNATVASPIAAAVQAAAGASNCAACVSGLVGGLTFPGVNGLSRSPYDSTFRSFQPRLGFAYQLSPKTIIRAGWGMFVTNMEYDPGSTGFSVTTTGTEYSPTDLPLNLLANPFPNGLLAATGSSLGLSTALGSSISFTDPHARPQQAQMFNFNVQRLLSPNTVLTVGYVYNRGTNLPISHNLNHMTQTQLSACLAAPTTCTTPVTNPFYGILPASSGSGLGAKTIAQSTLYNPYPQFTSVTEAASPLGDSEFHALQATLIRHFTHGISATVGYTNEKWAGHNFFANPTDPAPQKDIGCFDRPQMLQANWVYEIPIGRGHYLGGNMPRWANAILGGWQHNAVFFVWEGIPWNFQNNQAQPLAGVPKYASPRSTDHWLNPAAWQVPTYSSQFPNVTWSVIDDHVRLPRYHQMDQGIQKSFKVKERVTAMLRVSFWNSFNTPDWANQSNFSGSVSNRSNSAFGEITPTVGYSNNPRLGILEGRVDF
ncbi:MAG: TonB-dependent receptor [Terriglobia bacterium]